MFSLPKNFFIEARKFFGPPKKFFGLIEKFFTDLKKFFIPPKKFFILPKNFFAATGKRGNGPVLSCRTLGESALDKIGERTWTDRVRLSAESAPSGSVRKAVAGPAREVVFPRVISTPAIAGQLNAAERQILVDAVLKSPRHPKVVLEVGTWLGGGSTLHFLRALEEIGEGHLWGIEADPSIYEAMLANIGAAAPEALHRFTPLFGFSDVVIPRWLAEQGEEVCVDLVFLDGGNNPGEQITEFHLLDPHIPVGGQLLAHDAKMRKGKWLVPYLSCLDNWRVTLREGSEQGLLHAEKIAQHPSRTSKKAADALLWKMRLQPAEIAGALLPAKVCGFMLGLLPRKLAWKLSDGP